MLKDSWKLLGKGLSLAMMPLAAMPVHADSFKESEALVVRLAFEDCLGWVRDGKKPFEGLPIVPLSENDAFLLYPPLYDEVTVVELFSPRYVGMWGQESATTRACEVIERSLARSDISSNEPMLRVRTDGFIERFSLYAKDNLLTEFNADGVWPPGAFADWYGPMPSNSSTTPIHLRISPVGGVFDKNGVLDVESISVSGPNTDRRTSNSNSTPNHLKAF